MDYPGGIYALRMQQGLSVHPAAKTALAIHGRTHYLELAPGSVQLFGFWFGRYAETRNNDKLKAADVTATGHKLTRRKVVT